jgi:signal transduction histidine kinase
MSASRRNVFAAGFGLMLLVIAAAGYFVFRAVHRELGVARLQSDFVAAVSHEFRSPLTAMCHLTEMLEEGGTQTERLPDYYRAWERAGAARDGGNLLDFGRMDAGRRNTSCGHRRGRAGDASGAGVPRSNARRCAPGRLAGARERAARARPHPGGPEALALVRNPTTGHIRQPPPP